MIFTNRHTDDEEWTGLLELLNEATPADQQLRHILHYNRSGKHFPTHFYQELIEELMHGDTTVVFCAVGEYGIEFTSEIEQEVKDWIADEVNGEGNSNEPVSHDYYQIVSMTRTELDALPED